MPDNFEQKLQAAIAESQARIERERARVETLQEALDLYKRSQPSGRRSSTAKKPGQRRNGLSDIIMDELREAGSRGRTIQGLIEAAEARGRSVRRNSLRSVIWHLKQEGRIEQVGRGMYRSVDAKLTATSIGENEASGSEEPDASERQEDGNGNPSSSGGNGRTNFPAALPGASPAQPGE